MERSFGNLQLSSSNRKFQAIFASLDRYFTENSCWVPCTTCIRKLVYFPKNKCHGISQQLLQAPYVVANFSLCFRFHQHLRVIMYSFHFLSHSGILLIMLLSCMLHNVCKFSCILFSLLSRLFLCRVFLHVYQCLCQQSFFSRFP